MARLLAQRTQHALLTLGRDGAISCGEDGMWWLRPPSVRTVNAVGSGDAFAAGFLAGVARGFPGVEATRLGVACGASNAGRLEPGIGTPDEFSSLSVLLPSHGIKAS